MFGKFWQPGLAAVAVTTWLCSTAWLIAGDEDKGAPQKPAAKTESAVPEDGEKSGKAEPSLDDELLRSLGAKSSAVNNEIDRLDRAIKTMRDAQVKIDGKDTGQGTRDLQAQVVKDLDEVIKALQQLQSQPPPPPDENEEKSKEKDKKNKNKNQKTLLQRQEPGNSGQRKPSSSEVAGAPEKGHDKGGDTSDNTDPTKAGREEEARRQQMVKDVWGHLPPALRTELLNVYSEKYLPKYETLVRRYYESLAEKNKQNRAGAR